MNNKAKVIAGVCAVVGIVSIIVAFLLSGSKTYTITFDTDGGNNIPMQEVKKGEMVSKPVNPTKEGYTFIRWEYQNMAYDFTTSVTSDMTLKARWEKNQEEVKYKITFKIDGNTKEIEVSDVKEINLDILNFEEKEGFELVWYLDGNEYDFNTPLNSDVILEGKYEKVTTFTVKFNSNGGSNVASQKVKSKGKVKEPTNVTKYGFILDGWYLNNQKYDFNKEVTKGITLTAKWKEDPNITRYTVKFDSDKGSNVASQKVIENETVTTPKTPTKTGYKFVEWQLNGKKYDFKTKVSEDITLKAVWKELEKFTVTFSSDGGSTVPSSTVTEGNAVSKPANPTKDGYTFKEWQLDGKTFDFKTVITKNITLKAIYTQNVSSHEVMFNSDGKTIAPKQVIEHGRKITTIPNNPTKDGYTFVEWQLNGTKFDFNTPITSDITLEAKWNEVPVVKYTVTFNSNGGTSVRNQSVNAGSTAKEPTSPTWTDHTFKGWLLNGNPYNFSSAVNSDITLTASWEKVEVKDEYKVIATRADKLASPDSILKVYKNNNEITVKEFKFSDGYHLCDGSKPVATTNDIIGEKSLIVVLNDGTSVSATLIIEK